MAGFGKPDFAFADKSREPLPARLPSTAVQRTYTWIAPVHDLLARIVETRARTVLIDLADVFEGAAILEVGVGTGLTFEQLVTRNATGSTIGIDYTPAMLSRAQDRLSRAEQRDARISAAYQLKAGNAFDLEFDDHSFDLVVSTYMLDMFGEADAQTVLSEFRRVLRPGGRLALCHMAVPWTTWECIWDRLYALHPAILGGCRGISLAAAVKQCGLETRSIRRISYRTFPSEVIIASRPDRSLP